MPVVKPLPRYLSQRYHGWRATSFAENAGWYRRLADEGQRPRAMVVSCCDSRVHINSMFGTDTGEIFIHRNIANLVPPFAPDGEHRGTSAAVEYAVVHLKVAHLIVLGHSTCGGVRGCADMCKGHAPDMDGPESFIGKWLGILRPAFEQVKHIADADEQARALEMEGVKISVANLLSFPYVRDGAAAGTLSIHGLWHDLAQGQLYQLDGKTDAFSPI